MNETQGWYYLHKTSKDLIYKPSPDAIADIRGNNLCQMVWAFRDDRAAVWGMLVEALCIGASKKRIVELAAKWGINDEDAVNYAEYLGAEIGEDGNMKYARRADFINLQESPCGFGETYLEAFADLCKQLGYEYTKLLWHTPFEDLVRVKETEK